MRSILILLVIQTTTFAQVITSVQQKALDNYVAYANQSVDEVTSVVKSILNYYPTILQKNLNRMPYTCPVQLDDYYFNKAINEGKALGVSALSVTTKVKELRTWAEKIDSKCKALDTYFKLGDHKTDQFEKAKTLTNEIQVLVMEYKSKQNELKNELESVYKKLNKYVESNSYFKADALMRKQIEVERDFINTWNYNIHSEINTGWNVEALEKSILETDKQVKFFDSYTPSLKYPATSMYESFKSSLALILQTKRTGLDEYNSEAKKSDQHSNEVYLNLINYFNGALLSDYNTFIDFAQRDSYYGLKSIKFVTTFEIRDAEQSHSIELKPFTDIPRSAITATLQKVSLPKSTFSVLNNYIDFINESLDEVHYVQQTLRNLNSSAMYYKDLTSYKGKGGLRYDYDRFQIPLSLFQKTIEESKSIPAAYTKSFNDQTQVLLNILKEIDQLSAYLEIETKEKRYEKDNLKKIFEILERNKVLFSAFDLKKEQLYLDIRSIYESYSTNNFNSNSWFISGKALQQLVDFDHEGLFKAKVFYGGDATVTSIATDKIDQTLRDVISNEYSNMKGIEKIGRYNGNCPYIPYEDLPSNSKTLSEKLVKLKPPTKEYGYSHPYHDMVYMYNVIADNLNKFSELSKTVLLLKTVRQPELFEVSYPDKKENTEQDLPVEPVVQNTTPTSTPIIIEKPIEKKESNARPVDKLKIVHDTVYIEKRDTVYLADPGENLRSMEGYATNNMILLLDVSGSMNSSEKLPLLKTSVLDLLTMMRPEDEVSIITYSGKAKVLLQPTSFKNESQIKKVIEKLKSEGKTDGNAGLKMAYKVADENYVRGGNNRIILATDGEFAISDETIQLVERFVKEDIFISVFNFGKGNGSTKNLEKLCATGKGNYEYITKENVEFKLIREVKAKRKK